MFDNIGRKIKNLAELVTMLGIAFSVIGGFIICCIDEHLILPGLMVGAAGCFVSWLSSLWMYAFGQQVESTENIEKMLKNRLATLTEQNSPEEEQTEVLSAEAEKENTEESEKEEKEEDKRAFIILIGVALTFLVIILICDALMN